MRSHLSTPQFDVQNIEKNTGSLNVSTGFQPYSGVEIVVDNETVFTAGDSSGRVLTINNEWGTQTQANNILASIRGFTYQPYEAEDALVDPSAEIGDGVAVNNVYSGIYKMTRTYDQLMPADISAPQSEEIDHEYPYESKENREITRKFSAVESELSMTSSEIAAKVSETGGNASSFAWSLTSVGFSLISQNNIVFKCTSSGVEINGKITATSGKIGGFELHGTYMNYNGIVQTTTDRAGIYLGQNGLRINGTSGAYFLAQPNGNVEANNLRLRGTLYFSDGTSINSNNLRSGAQAAYSWNTNGTANGWTNTKEEWDNATDRYGSYPDVFRAKYLVGIVSVESNNGLFAEINGKSISWKSVTIGGETFYVLKGV